MMTCGDPLCRPCAELRVQGIKQVVRLRSVVMGAIATVLFLLACGMILDWFLHAR